MSIAIVATAISFDEIPRRAREPFGGFAEASLPPREELAIFTGTASAAMGIHASSRAHAARVSK